MSFVSFIILMIAFLLPYRNTSWAIIGGQEIPNLPFFVSVRTHLTSLCGGIIIASDVILTAAHCMFDFDQQLWLQRHQIYVAKGNFSDPNWLESSEWFTCKNYKKHYSYFPFSELEVNPFDLAIIQIERRINLGLDQNAAINLCTNSLRHREGVAIGMGVRSSNPRVDATVLIGVKLHSYYFCPAYYRFQDPEQGLEAPLLARLL